LPDSIDGEVRGFYVIVHDVTELTESRLQLESVIRQNEVLLSTINQQLLYSVTDRRGRIIEANENFCRISGYSLEELIGENHRMINSGTHPREFWQQVWKTISSGRAWHGEVCNRRKSGELYWVDSVIAPFIGHTGEIERFVSLRIDITQKKRAEAELTRIASLLRNVLAAATEFSVIATDKNGLITLFNAGAEHLLQYRADEMVGRQTPAIIHCNEEIAARSRELTAESGSEVDGFRVFVHKPEADGVESREWTYVRKDGSKVPVSLAVTVQRDSSGDITGYLGIAQDISSRLAYETALLEAKQSAESASEAKSTFLANMSHEIRTPMNGIIGLCYMLEKQAMAPASHDMVRKIQNASHQLLAIINDILDFSKIEARRIDLEVIPFDLQECLENLRSIASGALGKKQVILDIQTDTADARYLLGDPLRLTQVLTNLLSNAIKFTDFGSVRLSIDQARLRFRVSDTGIGIPEEKLSVIFEAFSQADNTISRSHGGTGLGLAICRSLVTLMGGEIEARSTPGEGSEFIIDLPFRLDHAQQAARRQRLAKQAETTSGPRLSGVRILLVDDSELNREVAEFILAREGALITNAINGQQAVVAVQHARFDIVLMDVQMPVMDGYEATRKIRALPDTADLPILALTAGAMESHRQLALQAGMDGFISKPFEATNLITTVQHHVAAHDKSRQETAADPALAQLMHALQQQFVSEKLPAHMDRLRQARREEQAELDELIFHVHKMAGEAGTVGLMALSKQARALENSLREDEQRRDTHLMHIEELLRLGEEVMNGDTHDDAALKDAG
ncbi:MAG: PAS domain S-box protein, partial [Perlucidibaca sp.]